MLRTVVPALAVYVAVSLCWGSGWRWWTRLAVAALLAAASLKFSGYEALGGDFFNPDLPLAALLVWETAFGALVALAALSAVRDVLRAAGFLWRAARGGKASGRSGSGRISAAMLAVCVAAAAWGVSVGAGQPVVRHREVEVPRLPASFDGTRVAQISDLHLGSILGPEWLSGVVAAVNAERPDIVCFTGDLSDGAVASRFADARPLRGLAAPEGVFAVTGNHEYYYGPGWPENLERLGFTLLDNRAVRIARGPDSIVVAGLPDRAAPRGGAAGPERDRILAALPQDTASILLEHRPESARENLRRASLQLSGHTHGGTMFFLGPVIAGPNGGFVRGLYRVGEAALHVHPGTGVWAGFCSRIGVPQEVTVLTLRSPARR